jgi:hypothetical protein
MFFFALMAIVFAACEHWPPGWTPPLDDDDDPADSGTATGTLDDGGVDSPADAPDAEYLPDSGTPAGGTDAECPQDSGTDTAAGVPDTGTNNDGPNCQCICEYPDAPPLDGGGEGGNGHWMLHCSYGDYYLSGEPLTGYHCQVGHDCILVVDTTNHPECTNGNIIYIPHDTCGNPCECP